MFYFLKQTFLELRHKSIKKLYVDSMRKVKKLTFLLAENSTPMEEKNRIFRGGVAREKSSGEFNKCHYC
jgi:hypothetical protein